MSVHMCDSPLPLCSGKKKGTSSYVTVQTSVSLWSRLRATVSVRICSVQAIHNHLALWPPAVLRPGSASRSSPAGGGWSRPPSCVRRSSTRLLLWTGPSGCRPTCPRTRRRTSRRRSWWACSRPTQRWRRHAAGRSSPGKRKLHLVIRVKENNGGTAGERRRGTKQQVSPKSKTSVRVCKNHYFTFDVVGGGMWPSIDFLFCFKICDQELWCFSLQPLLFRQSITSHLCISKRSDLRVRMLSCGEQRWMFFFISQYQADICVRPCTKYMKGLYIMMFL